MPSNQTPRVDTADKSLKFNGIDTASSTNQKKPLSSDAQLARRKTIDRRDGGQDNTLADDDRREQDRRSKAPKLQTAAEKKEEQDELKLQQHRKKILLAGCEPVMGFNYDYLAMDDYPENALVSAARRDRDYWLTICCIFGAIFLFGLLGFVPPGIAGISCGFGVLSAFFAFSPIRRFFFNRPRLEDLLLKRKELEFRALNHVRFLEGKDGLAWRCAKLNKYNSNLSKKIFSGLFHYSKERQLLSLVRQKKHVRLYLLLMIESQKAYKRLEKDYLENHFKNIENGLDDRINSQEANKLEQMLNVPNKKG